MADVASSASSSIDINSIVSQLMRVESRRKVLLQQKEASYQLKLSSVGNLSSAMASFKSSLNVLKVRANFESVKADSSDSTIISASASSTASEGVYNLEVTQLARANMLASTAYTDTTSTIGTGTLTIQVGSGASIDITIDSSNDSLTGIKNAINSSSAEVTASIVNDGSGYKLVMNADNMGSSNTIQVTVSGDSAGTDTDTSGLSNLVYDPSGTQNMTEIQVAQSATLQIGSGAGAMTITKDSNTITDVIEGVTLNLLKAEVGTTVSVTVANDRSTVKANVNKFVSDFNSLVTTIKDLTAYDSATQVSGPLSGDSVIRQVESNIRQAIGASIPGLSSGLTSLSQIGIATQSDGSLLVDSSKLDDAVLNNFDDIVKLFAKVGTATDPNVSMLSSTDNTVAGSYAVNITQPSTQGDFTGGAAIASLVISTGSNDTLSLSINGVAGSITLSAGTYASNAALAAEIQSKINGDTDFSSSGLTVSVTESSGVLTITSDTYGSASTVGTISGNAASNLSLDTGTSTTGIDVAGTIGGYTATGSGQNLTGSTGSPVEGLALTILGNTTGSRGSLTYSIGVAETVYNKMDAWLDSNTGIIKSKTDSINSSIEQIGNAVEREDRRLIKTEARLRKQFVSLQLLLDNMQGVSSFLSSQLVGFDNLIKGITR